jgi:predicted tellurium resistance membrane protein TerC
MRKYALAMGIRLVCLILVFVVDGWFKLVMVAGAVFLPWIAVVIANGSDKAEVHSDSLLDYVPLGELDSAEDVSGQEEDEPAPVLQGELVEDDDEPTHGQERRAS